MQKKSQKKTQKLNYPKKKPKKIPGTLLIIPRKYTNVAPLLLK